MIKRTVEISREPVYLSVKNDQLIIRPRAEGAEETSIPCEDMGFLVIDEPGTTVSAGALRRLMHHGAAVVVCGANHLPVGILLPTASHTEVVTRLHEQIAVSLPVRKRLWKQIVSAKIRAQAQALCADSPARRRLLGLVRTVRSGDPSNVEAQAAKIYWQHWLRADGASEPPRFRRDAEGPPPNNLLNYGYAVLRAAVARALVSAGLHPALGIHHAHRANAFALADDLLEPLRPLVDATVRTLFLEGDVQLTQPVKARLLELLTAKARIKNETGPLMVALHRMAASLVQCYRGEAKELLIPVVVDDASPC